MSAVNLARHVEVACFSVHKINVKRVYLVQTFASNTRLLKNRRVHWIVLVNACDELPQVLVDVRLFKVYDVFLSHCWLEN